MDIQGAKQGGTGRRGENGVLPDDQALVLRAKSGHSGAFGELYERHRSKIYHSALGILRHQQDAEDAGFHIFNLGDRIAINEALMMLRRRRVTTPVLETNNGELNATSPVDVADDGPTPEQAFAEKERRALVIGAISGLRKTLRTVAPLRELQGCRTRKPLDGLG